MTIKSILVRPPHLQSIHLLSKNTLTSQWSFEIRRFNRLMNPNHSLDES